MESFEQRMRVESDCYEDGRNGTVLFVHFEDAIDLAREADAALAASQHIIDTQRRVYDETIARMTDINTAKDGLISELEYFFNVMNTKESKYRAWYERFETLRARIRSLENG
jgi:hypothetical protein